MTNREKIKYFDNYQKNLMDTIIYYEKNQNKTSRLIGEVQRVEKQLKILKAIEIILVENQ